MTLSFLVLVRLTSCVLGGTGTNEFKCNFRKFKEGFKEEKGLEHNMTTNDRLYLMIDCKHF